MSKYYFEPVTGSMAVLKRDGTVETQRFIEQCTVCNDDYDATYAEPGSICPDCLDDIEDELFDEDEADDDWQDAFREDCPRE